MLQSHCVLCHALLFWIRKVKILSLLFPFYGGLSLSSPALPTPAPAPTPALTLISSHLRTTVKVCCKKSSLLNSSLHNLKRLRRIKTIFLALYV